MSKAMEDRIEYLRKVLKDYVESGKSLDDLKRTDPVYGLVANTSLVGEDGRRLSMEEKFAMLGFPRKRVRRPKLSDEEWIAEAKAMLKQYKEAGGKVEDLSREHKIYSFIMGRDLFVDGKRLNTEEKFTLLGEPRERKNAEDVEKALREDIERYLASGGSFHVRRKSLPFFQRLHSFVKRHNFASHEDAMKSLGYRNYSDTYYRFLGLQNISKFCDENGFFVYRRDMDNSEFHGCLQAASDTLQMPAALVVLLLCDKNLHKCIVETDYVEYLKAQLEAFANENDGFLGLRRKAPRLYSKLRHFKYFAFNDLDDELSTEAALAFMGLDDFKFRHMSRAKPDFDVSEELKEISRSSKGKVLTCSDFPMGLRKKLYINACRQGISVKDYLGQNGIEYKGLATGERFKHVLLYKYPYIDEMRQRRDVLLENATKGKGLCEEEIFEQRVLACQQAYQEYKSRINTFTGDSVDVKGKGKV